MLGVLTHDPKFDVPLLEVALRLDVAYVGAMGSRRTHEDRLERLHEAGLTEAELGRLGSPIGLDLGARTPEETAVSIAAEIIAAAVGWPRAAAGRPRRPDPPRRRPLRMPESGRKCPLLSLTCPRAAAETLVLGGRTALDDKASSHSDVASQPR